MNAFIPKTRIEQPGCSIGQSTRLASGTELRWTRGTVELVLRTIGDRVEQRYAVSLGPQPNLAGPAEGRVLDLEQTLAIVNDLEAGARELQPQSVPRIRRDRGRDPVAAFATDDVERAADPVDGLVEHDVVLQRIGTNHVIVVRVAGAPDQSARAFRRTGHRLEFRFDETILDVGVILQQQRIIGAAGLFHDL